MNILLINHYAGSTEMGMEFRPFYLAREWVKLGHTVTILAGDYSHLRQNNPVIETDFQESEESGIRYIWFKTGEYQGNGIKRALTMARFVGKLLLNAKKISRAVKPDVVIASSTYPLDTYAARAIAKKTKATLIHEVHDMWPASPVELGGMSRSNPFIVAMQIAENAAYRRSDYVVSLPSLAEGYMKQHGLRDGRFVCIRNGVVLEDWETPAPLPQTHLDTLRELKKEKFLVGYFGGHALSNALDTLLDAAKLLEGTNIQVVLVGDGVEKKRLQKRAEDEGISTVTFLPSVPKLAVPSLVEFFDCSCLTGLSSPLYRFGICMNKLFDSMMAAKPIICSIDTPDSILTDENCGVMVKAGDPEALAQTIRDLAKLPPEQLEEMGQNGRKAAIERYNYTALAKRFADLFVKS